MTQVTFEIGGKLEAVQAELANPTRILKQIGILMVAESQAAFKRQRFGDDAWPERGVPNVFGILSDFDAGKKKPPSRRFTDRPALRDTGRLAQSIAFQLVGTNVVEVGSNVEYAAVHHKGGKVKSAKLTETVRKALWKWLKSKDGAKWKRELGWLLNPKFRDKQIEGEVPARPFVGITETTRKNVASAVRATLVEL